MVKRGLSVAIAPEFRDVDETRAEIARLCTEMYPRHESEAGDFCLAATEAMNNAVEHSGAGRIEIEVLADAEGVTLRMSTAGERFDPTQGVSMPVLGDDAELPEGGFGLAIIKELVDSVEYEYSGGRNILTLRKTIPDNKREG